jgi:hypothetical protein
MKDECRAELEKLTGHKYIIFTRRGNASIRLALRLAKSLDYKKVLLQDQGGWITYKQFCEKEKLKTEYLKTEHGVIGEEQLRKHANCTLLINSMPAYSFLQDMNTIESVCKEKNIFLINDVSGSIGTESAKHGDVCLGSFGLDKPINLGDGGFISTNKKFYAEFIEKNNAEPEIDYKTLLERMQSLPKRLEHLKKIRNKLIRALESNEFASNILNKEGQGINILVKYSTDSEKEKLINIGDEEKIEHTLCPRKIRVNEKAVCFEIKRLQ